LSAAVDAWVALERVVEVATPPGDLALARAVVASALTVRGCDPPPTGAAAVFGEQMVIDVASVTDDQRSAALTELGDAAFAYVQAVWVADMGTRARSAFQSILGASVLNDDLAGDIVGGPGDPTWPAQELFLREVARLDALDPVTSELVRLRGARAHACRLCMSLRSRTAIELAGGSGLDAVDDHEHSGLTEQQKVALRFTDAFIWQPMTLDAGLASETRRVFAPDQATELVLDVMRNSANKIAVAFAADAAHVDEGVEYYDIDPTSGDPVYGLAPPT
jgi:hypothetical protein